MLPGKLPEDSVQGRGRGARAGPSAHRTDGSQDHMGRSERWRRAGPRIPAQEETPVAVNQDRRAGADAAGGRPGQVKVQAEVH